MKKVISMLLSIAIISSLGMMVFAEDTKELTYQKANSMVQDDSQVYAESFKVDDSYISPRSIAPNSSNITYKMTWKYDTKYAAQEAYGYIDAYIDGEFIDTTENTKSKSSTVSVSHNEAASGGIEFHGIFYGHTSTPAVTYWSTAKASYMKPGRNISINDAVRKFSDSILQDFGFDSNEFTQYMIGDSDLRSEVNYYYCYEMEKTKGSTLPIVYKEN